MYRHFSAIDCSEYLPQLEERLQELAEYDAPEEEKKHTQAELHALQELILQKKGVKNIRLTDGIVPVKCCF